MSSPIPFKNQERQDLDVDLECWTLCPRRFPSSVPSTVMAGLNKHRSFAEEAAFVSSVKPAAKKWGIWTIHDDLQLGKGLLTSSPYQLKRSRYVADVFTTCFCCPQVAKKNCYRLKKKNVVFFGRFVHDGPQPAHIQSRTFILLSLHMYAMSVDRRVKDGATLIKVKGSDCDTWKKKKRKKERRAIMNSPSLNVLFSLFCVFSLPLLV